MAISYEIVIFAQCCVTIWKMFRMVLEKSLCIDVLAWIIPETGFTNGIVNSGAY